MNYFKTTESRPLISSFFKISREEAHLLFYNTKKNTTYVYLLCNNILYVTQKRFICLYGL